MDDNDDFICDNAEEKLIMRKPNGVEKKQQKAVEFSSIRHCIRLT